MLPNHNVDSQNDLTQLDRDIYEQYMRQPLGSFCSNIFYLPLEPICVVLINLMPHLIADATHEIANGDAIDYGKQLGVGAYAVVKAGSYNGQPVALKIAHVDVDGYDSLYRESMMYEWLETAKKKSVNHPGANCIAQYFGCHDRGLQNGFVLVMELMHGSLEELIFGDIQNNLAASVLSAKEAKAIFYGIAVGLSFVHQHDLVYCDMKPANILYLRDAHGIHVKLTDFGIAKHKHTASDSGTPVYQAPEIWTFGLQSAKSDVYGMGITFWEVAARRPIYQSNPTIDDRDELQEYVTSGSRPAIVNATPKISAIIQRCWQQNANQRPTAEECSVQIQQLAEQECWAQPNTLS